ncbi:replication-associated recombination protein A [Candidatus Chloroploca asiatica]|uniref:AAA family ATPase n=1 Tax=Candidatus Chloroploca asiatica TaxID=1506545 RepID=A0A2H3KM86_9CHLR|nr:replication-associated recombination protein A [Candidatus Chloroploca asiatica]PDV98438.1 AAA family ATPase [Candidatus Chloroploca asiatica]
MPPKRGSTGGPTLFDAQRAQALEHQAPLAARMRPRTLDEYLGQEELVGEGRLLRRAIMADQLFSIILWGPPGSGKTTLARIMAASTSAHFEPLSAVSAGVNDLRRVIQEAQDRLGMFQQRTVLFIDEIHRFNKAQQDAVLPFVEDGTITLIGATTENPSFEVNNALLSRARVFTLQALSDEAMVQLVDRALADEVRGLGSFKVMLAADARGYLVNMSNGDARTALNALEAAVLSKPPSLGDKRLITLDDLRDALQTRATRYDKHGELHYDAISALHKSVRDSDPDGALYWLGRMLDGGEDPLYIARRIVRMALEDIGMADPAALPQTIAAQQAIHFLGQPEGELALAQAVVYLCQAPKSNAVYRAYGAALKDVAETRNEPVPLHLRNAPTRLMKGLGYGKGYEYAHDLAEGRSDQTHLPPNLEGRVYYEPTDRGFESRVRERLAWRAQRQPARPSPPPASAALDPQALSGEESQEPPEEAPSPGEHNKRRR